MLQLKKRQPMVTAVKIMQAYPASGEIATRSGHPARKKRGFLQFPIGLGHFLSYIPTADAIGQTTPPPYGKGNMAKTAVKKATKKAAVKKATAKAAAPKAIKESLTKAGLISHLAESTDLAAKDVRAVLAALDDTIAGSLSKRGVGSFTLPGMLKITATKVAAKPKRKGINPFTKEEQWFAAKPASVKVKVRPLKKLKDAAS